ncbi:MAG: F0F1 ATP synthase subunit A [Tissierellia bacterium]|nr:F0F1 ATP synthase subunit A [Tissierellia bacterium]
MVVILLSIGGIIIGGKFKNLDPTTKPKGILHIAEITVESMQNLVITNMGKHNLKFAPYILTLALFLLFSNLWGLLGLTPPTSDVSITMSLALITFALTQIFSFRSNGGFLGYLKSFTEPIVVITPVNIIGELANPISLSFRLFGNIMSGGLILGLVYAALGNFSPIFTPLLHAYFDIFAGVLQTFIFVMLTMLYVGGDAEKH